jgi:peptidoglycan hydrolase-like protein with peptidoglycan-binding domain
MRSQARTRLDSHGIDVDAVTDDFVSYQTVRRYLENHLNVQQDQPTEEEQKQRRIDRIFSLEGRLGTVTEETLDQLQRDHDLTLGDTDVLVNVTVSCPDCGTYAPVRELLDAGGCGCQ